MSEFPGGIVNPSPAARVPLQGLEKLDAELTDEEKICSPGEPVLVFRREVYTSDELPTLKLLAYSDANDQQLHWARNAGWAIERVGVQ